MHHVRLAVRGLDQIGMPGTLQFDIRTMASGQDIGIRVQLVGTFEIPRTRHRDGMSPPRSSLGGQQIVVAVSLIEVRTLGKAD